MKTMTMRFIALLAIALPLAAAVPPAAAQPSGNYLIHFQQPGTVDGSGVDTTSVPYFRDHQALMESRPFDGTVFYNYTSRHIMDDAPLSQSSIDGDYSPLASMTLTTLTHNFALVWTNRPCDFFDDWTNPIGNFARLAKTAKTYGLEGIYFDTEEYGNHLWDYPSSVSYSSTKTLQEYLTQAQLRGKQVMQAMIAQNPNIVVYVTHSACEADPIVAQWFTSNFDPNKSQLLGAFIAGLIEGASGTSARVGDSGEFRYQFRSANDYSIANEYMKNYLASAEVNCFFLPAALRPAYSGIGVGFMTYDQSYPYADVPIAGVHGGIDFGDGRWSVCGQVNRNPPYQNPRYGYFHSNLDASQFFTLPANRRVKSIDYQLAPVTGGSITMTVSDGVNPARSVTVSAVTTGTLTTSWTQNAPKVTISQSGSGYILFYAVRYWNGTSATTYSFDDVDSLTMNPATLRSTMTLALRRSEKYVFNYAEISKWWESGGVSQAWIDAVNGARSDAASQGRIADVVYAFGDLASGGAIPLNGVHSGIDFGTGKWQADIGSTWAGVTDYMYYKPVSANAKTFTLPSGKWLKAIRASSNIAGTLTISDGVNQTLTYNLAANSPVTITTGWRYPGTTVTLSSNLTGNNLVFTNIRY